MEELTPLVLRARHGDLDAYGELVRATQAVSHAAAFATLQDFSLAQDAVQEAYLRAFRRLEDLADPAAFAGWLRRIVITVALNMRRGQRTTLLRLDDVPEVPVLDEEEMTWSEAQRLHLAIAVIRLSSEERQLCDRRYHGRWSTARLADDAGIGESAMRKRLQRVRDKLRREIEMIEQRNVRSEDLGAELPAKVIELLARPKLTDLPDNPVGKTAETIRSVFADCETVELPEVVDLAAANESIGRIALYIAPDELHRLDDRRILRYDLTLPLLLTVRYSGTPLRLWAEGKTYRAGTTDATHLEAFHQAEVLWLDDRDQFDRWRVAGHVLESIERLLPQSRVKIVPTEYPMCTQAWELEVEHDGRSSEVLAWGVFNDQVVSHLGGDPARQTAVGVGFGLERLAMLRYGIDDIRKVDAASVA